MFDDVRFDDSRWLRRRHHAPPAAPRVLDHGPFLDAHAVVGLFLLVELPDRLGRFLKGRVVLVHQRLRDNGGDGFLQAAPAKLVVHRLLDLVANGPLRVRANRIQRHFMQDPARMFAAQQDEPDLRAVAVGDDDAEAALDEVGDVARGLDDGGVLVGHAACVRRP